MADWGTAGDWGSVGGDWGVAGGGSWDDQRALPNDLDAYGALNRARARLDATRENAGRLARSHGTWTTTGSGALVIGKAYRFNVTFVEEPSVEYGMSMPMLPTDGTATPVPQRLEDGSVPRCTGGVYQFVTGPGGLYYGAHVFFCVDFGNGGTPVNYTIHHSLTFTGLAIKDLPNAVVEQLKAP